ncbi:MAG: flagellar assembly protein FliW [Candidatus Cloacimonetes bacterium]|jgi:flagellar assembly factor FliW|nr:flagellar assembly protein FliW [Candidatus Cloacimonadota bacterium]
MKIYTTRFGEIEVNDNTVITFPSGILGFPDVKNYVLLDVDESSPLKWMQSTEEPSLAFVVTDPNLFKADYVINAHRSDLKDIEVEKAEDVVVLVLVTVPREPSRMTANLKGPVLINVKNNKAKQMIVDDVDYDIKYRLLSEDMIEQVV